MRPATKLGVFFSLCLVISSVRQTVSLPTPYQFGYRVDTTEGSHGHAEYSDGNGRVEGFYVINLGDGRLRTVRYYADETGFHPTIESNEPGVVSSNPANAPFSATALDGRARADLQPGQVLAPAPLLPNPAPVVLPRSAPAPLALPEAVRVAAPAPNVGLVTVAASAPVPGPAPQAALAPALSVAAPVPVPDLVPVSASLPAAGITPVSIPIPLPAQSSAKAGAAAVEEPVAARTDSDATIPAAGSEIERTVVDVEGANVPSEDPAIPASTLVADRS